MKTKFLFILLLLISIGFTSCEEEDAKESCEDLGCQWYQPLDEDEFICSC
ncbi:hypothetical protein C8D94_102145 [Marinirhabdus gelatinilytica]|uniref:Lipoprotein n=1 Tax=Marinirhabdus gelatinilytica TaxID=1703343 RepID=A0A370QF24_9FLAO|nr:hypothetical protein C8D94_102145 [Marinirhabdus gelatinilytica]